MRNTLSFWRVYGVHEYKHLVSAELNENMPEQPTIIHQCNKLNEFKFEIQL